LPARVTALAALAVSSPDGAFTAYVEDLPSIDPPRRALFVERKDQRHFMPIANLAEDVDSIEKVVWSPDSRIVLFHSRDYLAATRVADWQTVRVYLGKEWTRHGHGRRTTFSSGGRGSTVADIQFNASDGFTYRLTGDDHPRVVSSTNCRLPLRPPNLRHPTPKPDTAKRRCQSGGTPVCIPWGSGPMGYTRGNNGCHSVVSPGRLGGPGTGDWSTGLRYLDILGPYRRGKPGSP